MNEHRPRYVSSIRLALLIVCVMPPLLLPADVIINEIGYNPSEEFPFEYEFVELFNPANSSIDLSGYAFTDGIAFRIPDGTVLSSQGFLLIVRDPSHSTWRNRPAKVLGPYIGILDKGGELLRLRSPSGDVADEVTYDDSPPWPRGADGYGSTLERVHSSEPSDNPYSWRSSLATGGTPGLPNSVAGLLARPVMTSWSVSPSHPRSSDEVRVEVVLEGEAGKIRRVDLRYERWNTLSKDTLQTIQMEYVASRDRQTQYRAAIPPHPTQSLIRFNWRVVLTDGTTLILPHIAEPRPFESYFVYNGEIPSLLPILWMFPDRATNLISPSRTVRGVAIMPLESDSVQLFDGARIIPSLVDQTGRKIRFLKGEEYRNDRTINLSPESPTHPNSGGPDTNHKEHLAFQVFVDQGVRVPRCDWYRAIENGVQGQRTATQQVNEKFLEINEMDPMADIYKIAYNEPYQVPGFSIKFSKQTNLDTGSGDLTDFFVRLNSGTDAVRKRTVQELLELDRVIGYSVAGVLIGNWDGFFNNMFLIHTPFPIEKWECVPWDLDKTFGYTDGFPPHSTTFAEMPLEFPLNGQARLASRTPGFVSRPVHRIAEYHEIYLQRMRDALFGHFSLEEMNRRIGEIETLLLDDLQLEANYTGIYRTARKKQIESAYGTIRTFLNLRHAYLRPLLFTPVEEWPLY